MNKKLEDARAALDAAAAAYHAAVYEAEDAYWTTYGAVIDAELAAEAAAYEAALSRAKAARAKATKKLKK